MQPVLQAPEALGGIADMPAAEAPRGRAVTPAHKGSKEGWVHAVPVESEALAVSVARKATAESQATSS